MFVGPNGSGKTFSARYILAKLITEGYSGYHISMNELYNCYNQFMYDPLSERGILFSNIVEVDILLIDEAAKETGNSSNIVAAVEAILKKRSDNVQSTIVISNMLINKSNRC